MESKLTEHSAGITEDSVDQMLVLAERLREANGGILDDSAVQAVAEATGAPIEYVRLAVKLRTDKQKKSLSENLRTQYLTLDPDTRRYVVSGLFATLCGLMDAADQKANAVAHAHNTSTYGVFGMIGLFMLTVALYNACVCRDSKTAAIAGAIFGGGFRVTNAIFCYLLSVRTDIPPILLIPYALFGAIAGLALQRTVSKNRSMFGLRDPVKERQEMLRQLQDLQAKLESGKQAMTFLSVDIVGSTKMKQVADPLDVEFTFNEYYQYVEVITRRHGGSVHSTAGDGVTCAFSHPQHAFAAARNIHTGLIELNTYRNKIGLPIVLRQAVHSGTVVAPSADIKSVHFAHVIDIAAHLQKATPPATVAVSDSAAMYLPGGPATVGAERIEASGVQATVWSPRMSSVAPPSLPPPAPSLPTPSSDVL